jgi:hypothetical protein
MIHTILESQRADWENPEQMDLVYISIYTCISMYTYMLCYHHI